MGKRTSTSLVTGSVGTMRRPARVRPSPLSEAEQLLGLAVHWNGHAVVLTVDGEIDMLTAPLLEAAARRLLSTATPVVLLDMRDVTFMGVSGVAMLVRTAEAARQVRKQLRLVEPSHAVMRVLGKLGLADFLEGAA